MKLAYDTLGSGPPVIIVLGAFNTRDSARPLATALADRFAVTIYDRRGKGDSGDEPTYSVDKEVDDIAELMGAVGKAALLGFSSGAALALRAHHLATKLAVFDLPLSVDRVDPRDHTGAIAALVKAGKRGEAVEYFQRDVVGIPPAVIAGLKNAPFWPALERMAHTLVYETTICGDGLLRIPPITVPVLALAGEQGPPMFRAAAEALARGVPDGRSEVIAGVGHDLSPLLAPALSRFF